MTALAISPGQGQLQNRARELAFEANDHTYRQTDYLFAGLLVRANGSRRFF